MALLCGRVRHGDVAVDLPGYGDEPAWPESALYRLTDAAATIRSAIEARREQTDLVAHSFGAAVALRYALNNPARVRTLTLVEPTWFGILRDLGPKARRREEKSFVWRGLSPRLVPIRTACSRARLTMCTAEGWAIAVGCRVAGCRAARRHARVTRAMVIDAEERLRRLSSSRLEGPL